MNPSQDRSLQQWQQGIPFSVPGDEVQTLLNRKEILRKQRAALEAMERDTDYNLYLRGIQARQSQVAQLSHVPAPMAATPVTTVQYFPNPNLLETSARIEEVENVSGPSNLPQMQAVPNSQITRHNFYNQARGRPFGAAMDLYSGDPAMSSTFSQSSAVNSFPSPPGQGWSTVPSSRGESSGTMISNLDRPSNLGYGQSSNNYVHINGLPSASVQQSGFQNTSHFQQSSSMNQLNLPPPSISNGVELVSNNKGKERETTPHESIQLPDPSTIVNGGGASSHDQEPSGGSLAVLQELLSDHHAWTSAATERILGKILNPSSTSEEPQETSNQKNKSADIDGHLHLNTIGSSSKVPPQSSVTPPQLMVPPARPLSSLNRRTDDASSHTARTSGAVSSGSQLPPAIPPPPFAGEPASQPASSSTLSADPSRTTKQSFRVIPNTVKTSSITRPTPPAPTLASALVTPSGPARQSAPATPASADKKTLAQSLLRALRPPSTTKRKRDDTSVTPSVDSPLAKKGKFDTPTQPLVTETNVPNGPPSINPSVLRLRPPSAPTTSNTVPLPAHSVSVAGSSGQQQPGPVVVWPPYPTGWQTSAPVPSGSMSHVQLTPYTYSRPGPQYQPSSSSAPTSVTSAHLLQSSRPSSAPSTVNQWLGTQLDARAPSNFVPTTQQANQPSSTLQTLHHPKPAPAHSAPLLHLPSTPTHSPPKPPTPVFRPLPPSHVGSLQFASQSTSTATPSKPTREPLFLPSSSSPPSVPSKTPIRAEKKPEVVISQHRWNSVSSRPQEQSEASNSVVSDVRKTSLQGKGKRRVVLSPSSTRATSPIDSEARMPVKGMRPSGLVPYVLVPPLPSRISQRDKVKKSVDRRRGNDLEDPDVQDFASRLIRRPCLWKDCHAVLDSAEKLLKHLKIAHGQERRDEQMYKCQWVDCRRGFDDAENLIRHFPWHSTGRIHCAYKGCDFQTRVSTELTKHINKTHTHEKEVMCPYSLPTDLKVAPIPPSLDGLLPTYHSVPIPVSAHPISAERHLKIHAQILLKIVDDCFHTIVPLKVAGWRNAVRQRRYFSLNLEDWEVESERDIYRFVNTDRDKLSKPLVQLTQLPASIDCADFIEGNLSGEPLQPKSSMSRQVADPGPSSKRSIFSSPLKKGMVFVPEESEHEEEDSLDLLGPGERRPVVEDVVDSSEVENLL